jgi:two-component system phosphate regulon response regulator PhoB
MGSGGLVVFGRQKMDRAAHRGWVDSEEIEHTALEFKLLNTRFERRNRVQSRAELLVVVLGIQADVTARTVGTHVKRLREKIKGARDYLETVRGVGYRFVADAEEGSCSTPWITVGAWPRTSM